VNTTPKGYLWDFGNGSRSNNVSPSTTYTSAGTYTIKLIVVFDQSTREIVKNITIKPGIDVSLTTSRTQFCKPDTVQMDASVSVPGINTTYEWNYGDNSPVISGSNAQASHYFSQYGDYQIIVKATSPNGCQAIATKTVRISAPEIYGSYNIASGCVPVINNFRTRATIPAGSSILNYTWNFGDGTSLTNNNAILNHNYTTPGDFVPTVTLRTVEGCEKLFTFDTLHFGIPPTQLTAYADRSRFCASERVRFVAHAQMANQYDWSFGNNNFISSADTQVTHQFRTLGLRNVVVTAKYNNCASNPIRIVVRVDGAISRFEYENTCSNKNTFHFINNSTGGNLSSTWNFDDQNARITQTNAEHTFPSNGNFWATLIVKDSTSGCADTSKIKLYTAIPVLQNNQQNICVHSGSSFIVQNTYNNPFTSYMWNTLHQQTHTTQDSTYLPLADSLGIFTNNSVIISNGQGYCNDTLYLQHPITVRGPKAAFMAPTEICQSQALTLQNQSTHFPDPNENLIYSWNMGDNSSLINMQQPIPHHYQEEGRYNITLIAKDLNGCVDSIQHQVEIRPMPFLWIIPRSKSICQGQTETLTGYTSDRIQWHTTFPTATFCNTCDSNNISPIHSTTYIASSTNAYQCQVSDSISLRVYEPFNAQIEPVQASICERDSLSLNIYPSGKIIDWTNTSNLHLQNPYHPVAAPVSTSQYEVILKDSMNCFSSTASMHVQVNPRPAIELGDNKMLAWNTLYQFNPVYSNNVTSFLWTPSDKLTCATCPNPQITVKSLEQVTLKVTSDSGCVSTDNIALAVECNNAYLLMPGAFTPDGNGLNDLYYPITRGMKYIKKFYIYNRSSQLIFQRQEFHPNQPQFGWDGKFKGEPQPPGTYVFVMEAVCDFGLTTYKTGSFVLIR